MPVSRANAFAIRLHVWDSEKKPQDPGAHRDLIRHDPSLGHGLAEVSEEYFPSYQGVQFLPKSGATFHLLNAGRDLFFSEPDDEDASYISEDDVRTQQIEGEQLSSPLSSVPSSSPQLDSDPRLAVKENGELSPMSYSTGAPRGWFDRPKPQLTENVVQKKPLHKPMPMKVNYDFKEKSFKVDDYWKGGPQDLCVSVFYNGELVYSKGHRFSGEKSSTALGKQPNISGRRVHIQAEVPFMIMPLQDTGNLPDNGAGTNLEQRWNEISAMFRAEAGKWGKDPFGDFMTSDMEKYLEDLADMKMPSDMQKFSSNHQRNIGIIDIVCALGRAVNVSKTPLNNPQRPVATKIPLVEPREKKEKALLSSKKKEPMDDDSDELYGDYMSEDDLVEESLDPEDIPNVGSSASTTRKITRKASRENVSIASPYSDEEYHLETVYKPGPSRQGGPGQSSRAGQSSNDMSQSKISMSLQADNQDVSNDHRNKRHGDSSPEQKKSETKRTKTHAVTDQATENQASADTSKRSLRSTLKKKVTFEDLSHTPSRNRLTGREIQTPTPGSDLQSSPSSDMANLDLMETGDQTASSSSKNFKSKMHGFDGPSKDDSEDDSEDSSEDNSEFDFGLDGSKSKKAKKARALKRENEEATAALPVATPATLPAALPTSSEKKKGLSAEDKLFLKLKKASEDNRTPAAPNRYRTAPKGNPTSAVQIPDADEYSEDDESSDSSVNAEAFGMTRPQRKVETPVLPPASSSRRKGTPSLMAATSSNTKSSTTAKPKPKLVIKTGKDLSGVEGALSSPLTSRGYVTTEGRKAPTPKSATFPEIDRTPQPPAPTETPRPTRRTTRAFARKMSGQEGESSTAVLEAPSSSQPRPRATYTRQDWKPSALSEDSVLTYATKEQVGKWFRLDAAEAGHTLPTRKTRLHYPVPFRTYSILVGARYVLGADFDVKGKGKET